MATLFTEMAAAVIDELTPDERVLVDPKVFTRIISICAATADRLGVAAALDDAHVPPAMHFIRASLIIPGDFVWRDDLAFDVVDAVHYERDGEVTIVFAGARTIVRQFDDVVRCAVSQCAARRWNQERVQMSPEVVEALYAAYGAF